MSKSSELDARCVYALYKILGTSHAEHRARGIAIAETCGYAAYPSERVSLYLVSEPELAAAYKRGLALAHEANRPRGAAELKAIIDQMDKDSYAGCGQYYELYAQRFTGAVDSWIPSLRAGELETALALLKSTAYEPDPGGYWVYDQEEGDIHFIETNRDD